MSKKKRHSTSEIEAKLGQAAVLSSEGQTQSEIAKALGISVMTFHRWRKAKQPPLFSDGWRTHTWADRI